MPAAQTTKNIYLLQVGQLACASINQLIGRRSVCCACARFIKSSLESSTHPNRQITGVQQKERYDNEVSNLSLDTARAQHTESLMNMSLS
jgi:hypothetical protein